MRYIEFKLSKQAADPDYSALRRRFFEEVSSPDIYTPSKENVDERMRTTDKPRYIGRALKERGRILKFLQERIGWNNDDAPEEYWNLLRKVEQLYSNALLARYLPRKGVLDLDKIRSADRAGEVLKQLPEDLVRSVPLPKRELWTMPRGVFAKPEHARAGDLGEPLRKLLDSGAVRTYGDWIDALENNRKTMPRDMQRDYAEWKEYTKRNKNSKADEYL